jgi:hypothetical protein
LYEHVCDIIFTEKGQSKKEDEGKFNHKLLHQSKHNIIAINLNVSIYKCFSIKHWPLDNGSPPRIFICPGISNIFIAFINFWDYNIGWK